MAVLIDSVLSSTPRATMMSRLFLAILPQSAVAWIVGLAIIGLLIKLVGDVLGQVNRMITARINYNGLMRVRCELFRKIQVMSLSYHRARPQADAIYRLSQDTYGCQAIMSTLIATGVASVTLIVMTGILLSRNATLTVLALGIAPFLFATNVIFERRLKARSRCHASRAPSNSTTFTSPTKAERSTRRRCLRASAPAHQHRPCALGAVAGHRA